MPPMFTDLATDDMSSENPEILDQGTPVSVKIRQRLTAARQRFNANDNIADFIRPGELEQLLEEVESKMQAVLDSMVIDTATTTILLLLRAVWPKCM